MKRIICAVLASFMLVLCVFTSACKKTEKTPEKTETVIDYLLEDVFRQQRLTVEKYEKAIADINTYVSQNGVDERAIVAYSSVEKNLINIMPYITLSDVNTFYYDFYELCSKFEGYENDESKLATLKDVTDKYAGFIPLLINDKKPAERDASELEAVFDIYRNAVGIIDIYKPNKDSGIALMKVADNYLIGAEDLGDEAFDKCREYVIFAAAFYSAFSKDTATLKAALEEIKTNYADAMPLFYGFFALDFDGKADLEGDFENAYKGSADTTAINVSDAVARIFEAAPEK